MRAHIKCVHACICDATCEWCCNSGLMHLCYANLHMCEWARVPVLAGKMVDDKSQIHVQYS